jgi:hypothetical protein
MAGWRMEFPKHGITFESDRMRRERHELVGELLVRCEKPEALAVNGVLSLADFNFSSLRARKERASHLAERARTHGIDWYGLLEEFCQGTFERERQGSPAVDIWDIPERRELDDFAIDGLAFPRRLPSILFGDGGSAKSYLCLYIAGRLAMQGIPVALFDWELSGEEHRERFGLMFGSHQPRPTIKYCRCESPLTYEVDRILRIIQNEQIQYAIFDSISFAADGRAEEHETCLRYFRCCRQLKIGGIHVAHTNRSEEADKKPFGSAFWHNGARCTWFAKAEPESSGVLDLGVHHKKANLGPLRPSVIYRIYFTSQFTRFARVSVQDTPAIASDVKVWERIQALIERHGPLTFADMVEKLDIKLDTIQKTVRRKTSLFHVIPGGSGEQDRVAIVLGGAFQP